jgi:hypothetical protein
MLSDFINRQLNVDETIKILTRIAGCEKNKQNIKNGENYQIA